MTDNEPINSDEPTEIEDLPDEWRNRAQYINPENHKQEAYWKGVRSAYHDLAAELERSLEHGTDELETKYSPAGFHAPDPELDDGLAVCPGCGETAPVEQLGAVGDEIVEDDTGAIVRVRRVYVHNDEECMMGLIEGIE